MTDNLKIHYDEEGDFLEVRLDKSTTGFFIDKGNDIFERVDEKTNEVIGIAIFNFKKKASEKDISLSLPFKIQPAVAL